MFLPSTQQQDLESKFPTGKKIMCNNEIYTVCMYDLDIDSRISAKKDSDSKQRWLYPNDCRNVEELDELINALIEYKNNPK